MTLANFVTVPESGIADMFAFHCNRSRKTGSARAEISEQKFRARMLVGCNNVDSTSFDMHAETLIQWHQFVLKTHRTQTRV